MEERLTVKQWDEADRPREKLMVQGAEALTPAELLAILIGSGSTRESAVALMRRVLNDCEGSLKRLGKMDIEELCRYNGIGEAKAITILAACELGRRRAAEPADERPRMDSPARIYDHFRRLEDADREEFHVMLMNQNLRLIGTACIGKGGLTATAADVRLVLREALLQKAPHIAVCHNHPSGNPHPSSLDNQLTEKIRRAAEVMDIRLVDHIIVGDGTYYSYQEQGKL
ncbi:MAG: DNA repair protein RadC [Alloprevotella sp.]|nr:DNA repair protein RadC [Alloprevotella sp.]